MSANFYESSLQKSCDHVLNSVRESCLNFSLQETPYSLYLSVRKSFARNKDAPDQIQALVRNVNSDCEDEMKTLKTKLDDVEEQNLDLKQKFEEMAKECGNKDKQLKILETKSLKSKEEKTKLEKVHEDVERNFKVMVKQVKEKDKVIYDLQKENGFISDNLLKLKTKFSNLTSTVNKERKKEEKKMKAQQGREFMDNLVADSKEQSFECNLCDMKCDTLPNLQKHVRAFHQRSFSTQTIEKIMLDKKIEAKQKEFVSEKLVQTEEKSDSQEFEKYPCYYCDYEILDEQHLIEHKLKCHRKWSVNKIKPYSTSSSTLTTHSKAFSFPVGFPPPTSTQTFPYDNPRWLTPLNVTDVDERQTQKLT